MKGHKTKTSQTSRLSRILGLVSLLFAISWHLSGQGASCVATIPSPGNAVSVISSYGVGSANNSLGAPDGSYTVFKNRNDRLDLNLVNTVPDEDIIQFRIRRASSGTSPILLVEGSYDGVDWDGGAIYTISNTSFANIDYEVNAIGGIRYLRFYFSEGSTDMHLDAVSYFNKCLPCQANAGSMTSKAFLPLCFSGNINITNTTSGHNATADYTTQYFLVDTTTQLISAINPTGTFNVSSPGVYKIYAFNQYNIAPANPAPAIGMDVRDAYSPGTGYATGCYALATNGSVFQLKLKPAASATSNSPVCSGFDDICLSAAEVEGAQYSWLGPNSFASGQRKPVITNAPANSAGTYSVTVTAVNGCTATSSTVVAIQSYANCVADLSLSQTVDQGMALINQQVAFTLTLTNGGPNTASNVQVKNYLPQGLSYVNSNGGAAYDSTSGTWTIASLSPGNSTSLTITAVVTTYGLFKHYAEVAVATDQPDADSTPGNGVITEDDVAPASVTVSCQ